MKNLKKVLAMVLAFACTFTMFASAKVYDDVAAGSEHSEAITMLSDLGIIQGKGENKYAPKDTITRAEACALIARLMTGDPNAAGFGGAHHFKDVVKGSWQDSAIGYCVVNGVAIGVDAAGTRFEPNRPIKDKEFVTMLVRALGYETPDMKKDFPFSYMSSARAIGLLENVNMIPDTDALRGEDAQVIYNALFADYARGAKILNTTHGTSVEKYPTLAESVWGLNRAAIGTWNKKDKDDENVKLSNCKAHTWVIIGEAKDEEDALLAYPIDDESTDLYKAEDKKHMYKAYKFKYAGDADALKGYKVELWGAGKHNEPTWEKDGDKFVYSKDWTIKAIKTVAGQTKYDYNSSMADKKDDNGTIEMGETSLKLDSVADNAKVVKHSDEVAEVVTFAGKELNTVKIEKAKDVEKALNVRNGMQFKLMDWDSDGDIDWIVVDEARYYKVESATSKRVNVTSMKGSNLMSDMDSKTETWKLDENEKLGKNEAGKDIKIKYEVPEGLKEGDIVEVTYKVTYEGKAQLITATVKTVDADNQKLEKVGTKDGLTMTFGDKEVKVAQNAQYGDVIVPKNPEKYKGFNGEELGTEFALYQNRNGFIVYSDYATESSNYMMVLDTEGGKNQTGKRDLAVIDFVDAENKVHKDVKVASDLRLLDKDGKTMTTTFSAPVPGGPVTENTYKDRKFHEQDVVGNVFKYWTDADGVITKMQAVFASEDAKAASTKEGYEYKADADRLIDNAGKYVASLEDANVIFAVKNNYIKIDTDADATTGFLGYENLEVDSNDVLATKQKDIPDIGGKAVTKNEALLENAPQRNTWLGDSRKNNNQFAVNLNKNYEATAAILGVNNFNKFSAGQTKLALVTNISERNGGTIEAEVAYNGELTTLSSVDKQDFSDIVKVFDGNEDHDVSGVDTNITAKSTVTTKAGTKNYVNGVFDGERLSEIVNRGGQYAEVTTDADGKLTKVVFLDDDATNKNLMTGHYYHVSRNLVLSRNEKNLKYGLNNNNAADKNRTQYFASDEELYTVGRLAADSASYADEAKFYQITERPSRHDKKYDGTQLSVNAGFDNLKQSDIKVIEKLDVDASEPDYKTTKNLYEISDLAFNSDDDLVAVYSFKNMKEKDAAGVVQFTNSNPKSSYNATEKFSVTPSMMNGDTVPALTTIAVFNEKGNNVSDLFTIDQTTKTITVKTETPSGTYFVRLLDKDRNLMAGVYQFVVANTTDVDPLKINKVEFADATNGASTTALINKDGKSFDILLTTVTRNITADLKKGNVTVYVDGKPVGVESVVKKTATVYTVTLENPIVIGSKIQVGITADDKVQLPEGNTNGLITDEVVTQAAPEAPVVVADGVQVVDKFGTELTGGASPANEIYFKLTKDGKPLADKLENVSILGDNGFPHQTVTVEGNAKGVYMITNKVAGTKVPAGDYFIAVNGNNVATIKVASFELEQKELNLTAFTAPASSDRMTFAVGGYEAKDVVISAGTTISDGAVTEVIDSDLNVKVTVDGDAHTVSVDKETIPQKAGTAEFTVGVPGTEFKKTFSVTVGQATLSGITVEGKKAYKKVIIRGLASDKQAKRLAEELNALPNKDKTVWVGRDTANTPIAFSAANAESKTVKLTVEEDLSSKKKVKVELKGLQTFKDKTDVTEGTIS